MGNEDGKPVPNTATVYPDGTRIELTRAMLEAGMAQLDDIPDIDTFNRTVSVFCQMIRTLLKEGGSYAIPETQKEPPDAV